ncbi:MAG TPA: hypothetical protein ENN39_05690 [Desulfonatronum sp.]|nr:hypothetical protein [Desulfonatronum sp.]
MQAIRTIQSVEGGKLSVSLPPEFQHTRVEVIILPCPPTDFDSRKEESQDWKKDFLSVSTWGQEDVAKVESWNIQEFKSIHPWS